jgi:2-amino-4-hydroxy-6-hydroxymethyldihydropteridine diphosphokinase
MTGTLISLGANLGNPLESMQSAKRLLIDHFGPSRVLFSQLYRTPPVGGPEGQEDFLNAVAAIDSSRSAWEIWEVIKSIETTLGRQRLHRWESRRIDIDLLLHHNERIWTPHLKVPHPRMCMRTFVLQPAREIVRNWIDPVTGWSIERMEDHLSKNTGSRSVVYVVSPNSEQLALLRGAFESSERSSSHSVQWIATDDLVSTMDRLNSQREELAASLCKLLIAAVASPDPMTILWEDYSSKWATQLGMRGSGTEPTHAFSFPQLGPRYLLPANDVAWSVHEIQAATEAMTCQIEAMPGAW